MLTTMYFRITYATANTRLIALIAVSWFSTDEGLHQVLVGTPNC